MLAGAFGVSSQAQAFVLIDGFGDAPGTGTFLTDTTNTGSPSSSTADDLIADTDFMNAERHFTATAVSSSGNLFGSTDIIANANGLTGDPSSILEISNSANSTGLASIFYTLNGGDFYDYGNAIVLDVKTIDLSTQVEIVINGLASSGFQSFTGTGQFYALLSSFSNNSELNSVSTVQLNFKGAQSYDGTFDNFGIDTPPPPQSAPEPATMALMGLGLAGFAAARKRKQA